MSCILSSLPYIIMEYQLRNICWLQLRGAEDKDQIMLLPLIRLALLL